MKWKKTDRENAPPAEGWYWVSLSLSDNPKGVFFYKPDLHGIFNYLLNTNKEIYVSGPLEQPKDLADDNLIEHDTTEK